MSFTLCIVFVQQEEAKSSPRQDGIFGEIEVMVKKHGNEMLKEVGELPFIYLPFIQLMLLKRLS